MTDVDALLAERDLQLLLCVGTGGVGKTTLSAALAVRAAHLGRRVLVVTIDPARRLAQAMGLGVLTHHEVPVPLPGARGTLSALMLDVRHAFDEALTARVRPDQAARIRANPFYTALADSFSGTQEYVAMEKVGELHRRARRSGEWDLIVVDTPPSASALDFLNGPSRLEALAHNPILRVVLGLPRGPLALLDAGVALATRALDAILGGRLFGDLRAFLQVFERALASFETHAAQTRRVLASPQSAFVVVAAPRPGPVAEAVTLIERLRRDALPVRGVLVNQLTPASEEHSHRGEPVTEDQRRVLAHHRELRTRAGHERDAIKPLIGTGLPIRQVYRYPGGVSDVTSLTAVFGCGQEQLTP